MRSVSWGHLGSQLPLPLGGAVEGGAAAGAVAVAEDGTLCKIDDVAALVERILSRQQSRLQLLPQQQVVPGLLHLKTRAQDDFNGCGADVEYYRLHGGTLLGQDECIEDSLHMPLFTISK